MMTQLVTPEQMRRLDHETIHTIGIPGMVLMERAALGATQLLLERFPHARRIVVLCGGGNNGGDGLAMARMLDAAGLEVEIVQLSDAEKLTGEARLNWEIVARLGLRVLPLWCIEEYSDVERALEGLGPCDVWCDAMLGTGLTREVTGRYAAAIDFINRQQHIFAVDVPSGLDALTGQVLGRCVRAHATASFGLLKLGQALYPGRALCGELRVIDIGLPDAVISAADIQSVWLTRAWARAHSRPRHPTLHKGSAGKILILAGSETMSGAAILCARGALLGGAGLVTVGTRAEVVSRISVAVPEAMAAGLLPSSTDAEDEAGLLALGAHMDRADVIAMGPGLGVDEALVELVQHVLIDPRQRLVLDADALNLIARHGLLDALRRGSLQRQIVLTPHPGEMARLVGVSIEELLLDAVEHARTLAQVTQCVVVLKTASTTIAAPDGRLAVNSSGNPGMASGGMGDALTGILAAQLAVQPDAFVAACLAVWLHGAAGDICRDRCGEQATSASGLLDALGEVFASL